MYAVVPTYIWLGMSAREGHAVGLVVLRMVDGECQYPPLSRYIVLGRLAWSWVVCGDEIVREGSTVPIYYYVLAFHMDDEQTMSIS